MRKTLLILSFISFFLLINLTFLSGGSGPIFRTPFSLQAVFGGEAAGSRPVPTRLTVWGPETAVPAGGTVTYTAKLETADGSAVLANRKLILTLNHEEEKRVVAITDANGNATLSYVMSNSSDSSCCINEGSEPTEYLMRIRFEGDATNPPTWADAVLGYRTGGDTGSTYKIVIDQAPAVIDTNTTTDLTISVLVTRNGVPLNKARVYFESFDLGQYSSGQTGTDGRTYAIFKVNGKQSGTYAISAIVVKLEDGNDTIPQAASDTVTFQLRGPNPPVLAEREGGWYWWMGGDTTPPQTTTITPLGHYHRFEDTSLVGTGSGAKVNTTTLDGLVTEAIGRTITYADGTTGPPGLIIGYYLQTEANAAHNLFGYTYYKLSKCGKYAPPLNNSSFRSAWANNVASQLRMWYNGNANAQQVLVGIAAGAGFHGEWSNPFTNDACRTQYKAIVGHQVSADIVNLRKAVEASLAAQFAGTQVAISTEGVGGDSSPGQYAQPVAVKWSVLGWLSSNVYNQRIAKGNWVAMGRASVKSGGWFQCEDGGATHLVGSALVPVDSTLRNTFPGRWWGPWVMTLQAADAMCGHLHGEPSDGYWDAWQWPNMADDVSPQTPGDGPASITDFGDVGGWDRFTKLLITNIPYEMRTMLAWGAHQAASPGWTKDTGHVYSNYVTGWNSDRYGDYTVGLHRLDVAGYANTPIHRGQLPTTAAQTWYMVSPWVKREPGNTPPLWIGDDSTMPNLTDSVGLSQRQGTRFYWDVYDRWTYLHSGIHFYVWVLDNTTKNLTLTWTTASGTRSQTLARTNTNTWKEFHFTLTGFAENGNNPLGSWANLQLVGTGSDRITVNFARLVARADVVPPTAKPGGPTNIPTNTPTSTPAPTGSQLSPIPTTNPNCLCQQNVCNPSCNFQQPANQSYSCFLNNYLFSTAPSAKNKNSWCQRPKRTLGDADDDGKVKKLDYYYYVSAVNGGKIPVTVNPDFNGDGEVGAADRRIVITTLIQTPTPTPISTPTRNHE